MPRPRSAVPAAAKYRKSSICSHSRRCRLCHLYLRLDRTTQGSRTRPSWCCEPSRMDARGTTLRRRRCIPCIGEFRLRHVDPGVVSRPCLGRDRSLGTAPSSRRRREAGQLSPPAASNPRTRDSYHLEPFVGRGLHRSRRHPLHRCRGGSLRTLRASHGCRTRHPALQFLRPYRDNRLVNLPSI